MKRGRCTLLPHIFRNLVQRMDADIQHVAVLIHQLDDLLFHAVHVHFRQSLINTNAVVDMYHIITGLQVINLFQGESFASFVTVANDKTMVTFKDLMVGINAQLAVLVAKALVQHETHRCIEVGGSVIGLMLGIIHLQQIPDDVFHTGALLLIFGQKYRRIAVLAVVDPFCQKHIHILTERILRGNFKIANGGIFLEIIRFNFYNLMIFNILQKEIRINIEVFGQKVADGRINLFKRLHHFLEIAVESSLDVVGLFQPEDVVGGKKIEKANTFLHFQIGGERHNMQRIHLFDRKLRICIKKTDRFNLIPGQFYSVRIFFRKGEDVEDGAAPRELSRLEDEIVLPVLRLIQEIDEIIDGKRLPFLDGERILFQDFG